MFDIGSRRWPGISKLIEECGEVVQVCGKLIASRGEVLHFDASNLRDRLQDEIADVLAACRFVTAFCGLDIELIEERAAAKLALFTHWHATNPEPGDRARHPDDVRTWSDRSAFEVES